VTPAKSTRLPHDERREQLVALGLELLGRTPHDQVSIGEIARAAGISKGLLYHYFPTKSDFVVAVLRASRDELERRMAPAPARTRRSATCCRRVARAASVGWSTSPRRWRRSRGPTSSRRR
jgi:AcrR family transcriptional regulator